MTDPTLPERLRELSTRFTMPEHADDVREALTGAADELERLTRPPAPPIDLIDPSDVIYALRYGLEHRDYVGTSHDLEIRREALRLLSTATLARLERETHPLHVTGYGPDGQAPPLHALGAELAGDAGVPAPTPEGRRFAARYGRGTPDDSGGAYFRGDPPAPGSFVMLGPVGSAWRVLAVDELAGHPPATHVLELEAVDPHDVPAHARVETVPMPVDELDADALYDSEGGES